jgi:5-formyltetrahydrofolate cyclo-ligase
MEPDPDTREGVDLRKIDLIIVPGLGFDRGKNRLGRGEGFYDRFLKTVKPPTIKVGVAFDCQIQDALPHNPAWDEKVDLIVGETSII